MRTVDAVESRELAAHRDRAAGPVEPAAQPEALPAVRVLDDSVERDVRTDDDGPHGVSPCVGLGGYEGRASLRTWLYRIATNRCLNARRSAGRRPATQWDVPGVAPPEPTRLRDVVWLEPFPDTLLDGAVDPRPGLQAARAGLRHRRPADDREPAPAARSPAEETTVASFVRAWEAAEPTRW